MSGPEIDLFTARWHRFADKGLAVTDAEALASKLLARDRDADDRRTCLECRHLSGYRKSSWRCVNWQSDEIVPRTHILELPADLVLQFQRCDGFAPHLTTTHLGNEDEHAQH